MKGEHVVHLKRGFRNGIWSGMSIKAINMKISKGSEGIIGQTTNFRSVTIWVNSHHFCSQIVTELEGLRNKVKKYNKHKEEGKRRIKLDMEDRKKLYTTLQNCTHPLEVEQHITTKLVNIYTGRDVSENVNVTEPVTFLCLFVGGRIKCTRGKIIKIS